MATPADPPNPDKVRLSSMATHRGARRLRTQLAAIPGPRSLDAIKIDAAYTGYHKTFSDRLRSLKNAPAIARRLATVVPSSDVLDVQLWLAGTPKLRRWMGPKTLHKLRGESKQMQTTMHESSVEVPKNDILNDKLGLYSEQIGGMADAYEWALDDLVITMLCAGIQGTALGTTYDGQNLIDTDHTYLSAGGTAQSNKVTGAFSASTYNTAWNRYST
jgi:phage major head subunit gpT-like protein